MHRKLQHGTIIGVIHDNSTAGAQGASTNPFRAGALAIVTLSGPREKFWGAILALEPAGVSLRGIALDSLDDFMRQMRSEEQVDAAAVFFPMHRVEKIELDEREGEVPSIAERFEAKTGRDARAVFGFAAGARG